MFVHDTFASCDLLILPSQNIYIIERKIRTFNLSSPIEAFQFASFLIRLQEHTDTLKDLFERKKAEFCLKAKRGQLPRWTKIEQPKELEAATVLVDAAEDE
jgi:hypothetical protein